MSKSKEYYNSFNYETSDPKHRILIMKAEIVGKTMNHKTLEDAKELIKEELNINAINDVKKDYEMSVFRDGILKGFAIAETILVTELEKLKL